MEPSTCFDDDFCCCNNFYHNFYLPLIWLNTVLVLSINFFYLLMCFRLVFHIRFILNMSFILSQLTFCAIRGFDLQSLEILSPDTILPDIVVNPTFICVSESRCPPLLSQIVNTTSVTANTVVNVTCLDSQKMAGDDNKMTSVTSTCDVYGRWQPTVPECIGTNKAHNQSLVYII